MIPFQVILYVQQRRKYTAWCERKQTIPPTEIQTLAAGGGAQAPAWLTRRSGDSAVAGSGWLFWHHCSRECPECMTLGVVVSLWVVQVEWATFQGHVSIAVCRFPPEDPLSWHSFLLQQLPLLQGWALPPVVYSLTLRGLICSYLKWQKEEEGEAKLLTWFSLSLLSQILFWSPLPGSSPSPLKSAVSSCWPPGLMGLLASCLTSHINLPSLLQISADQISHFQDSGHKAPFSGIISN